MIKAKFTREFLEHELQTKSLRKIIKETGCSTYYVRNTFKQFGLSLKKGKKGPSNITGHTLVQIQNPADA